MGTPRGSAPSLLELEAVSSRARRSGRGRRASRPAVWFTRIGSLLAVLAAGWFLAQLQQDVEAGRYGEIEAGRMRLDTGPGWFDPRWEFELARTMAALGVLDPDDRGAIEEVAAAALGLSFVSEVGEPTVIWPDGLRLDLKLRVPVACVVAPPGRQYATLSVDGTVLSGRWSAPPDRASGFLPLLIPSDSLYLERGARIEDPAIVDGLAVAAALWRELPPAELARLGRLVIDARRSRQTSPEEPGTVLLLEDGREVVFGRSPNLDAPGETPVHIKLRSLARALAPGLERWALVDLRWDRPEVLVPPGPETLEPAGGEGAEPGAAAAGSGDQARW